MEWVKRYAAAFQVDLFLIHTTLNEIELHRSRFSLRRLRLLLLLYGATSCRAAHGIGQECTFAPMQPNTKSSFVVLTSQLVAPRLILWSALMRTYR